MAARMLKVDAIALTRMISLPFILLMGFLPLILGEGALLVLLFGASYVGRTSIFRLSRPLDDAFNMEVLEPRERATSTGIEIAAGAAVASLSMFISSRLMGSGDFTTPFLMMATAFLISTVIYWRVFRPLEVSLSGADAEPELELEVEAGRAD